MGEIKKKRKKTRKKKRGTGGTCKPGKIVPSRGSVYAYVWVKPKKREKRRDMQTWQDSAIERSRYELLLACAVFPENKEVHRTNFCDVLLLSEEPQDLRISLISSQFLRQESRGVVSSHFIVAYPARPGAPKRVLG